MTYRKVLLAAALAASASMAHAGESVPTVAWDCWYDPDRGPGLACRLAMAPDIAVGAPGSSQLPGLTPTIRSQPGTLAAEIVVIPLFGPSADLARLTRLARAVMCGRQEGCQVEVSPERPR